MASETDEQTAPEPNPGTKAALEMELAHLRESLVVKENQIKAAEEVAKKAQDDLAQERKRSEGLDEEIEALRAANATPGDLSVAGGTVTVNAKGEVVS